MALAISVSFTSFLYILFILFSFYSFTTECSGLFHYPESVWHDCSRDWYGKLLSFVTLFACCDLSPDGFREFELDDGV
mgnify:CR=1 FL=1